MLFIVVCLTKKFFIPQPGEDGPIDLYKDSDIEPLWLYGYLIDISNFGMWWINLLLIII